MPGRLLSRGPATFNVSMAYSRSHARTLAAASAVIPMSSCTTRCGLPFCRAKASVASVPPSSSPRLTIKVTHAALKGLAALFRAGYRYKKAGVLLTLLSDKHSRQSTLFDDQAAREKSTKLMAAIDAINRAYGRDTVHLAVSGTLQRWVMRAGNRSPNYTTRWDELPLAS